MRCPHLPSKPLHGFSQAATQAALLGMFGGARPEPASSAAPLVDPSLPSWACGVVRLSQ